MPAGQCLWPHEWCCKVLRLRGRIGKGAMSDVTEQEWVFMSEPVVDLGAIRGDWNFHARYVTNAIEQTLKRTAKLWKALKASSPSEGEVPMNDPMMEEFIEACRQTRALTDDVILLQETRPAAAKKSRGKSKRRLKKAVRK